MALAGGPAAAVVLDPAVRGNGADEEGAPKWGEIDPGWWWRESRSGTTFRRREFQDLLDFCTPGIGRATAIG
jgi:hypothetical protein